MQFLQLLLLLPVTLTLATDTTKPPKGAVVVNINSNSEGVFKSVKRTLSLSLRLTPPKIQNH